MRIFFEKNLKAKCPDLLDGFAPIKGDRNRNLLKRVFGEYFVNSINFIYLFAHVLSYYRCDVKELLNIPEFSHCHINPFIYDFSKVIFLGFHIIHINKFRYGSISSSPLQ